MDVLDGGDGLVLVAEFPRRIARGELILPIDLPHRLVAPGVGLLVEPAEGVDEQIPSLFIGEDLYRKPCEDSAAPPRERVRAKPTPHERTVPASTASAARCAVPLDDARRLNDWRVADLFGVNQKTSVPARASIVGTLVP